jgi:ribose/xylose/arabinose/galactoside ABC-type transport system permease subunit
MTGQAIVESKTPRTPRLARGLASESVMLLLSVSYFVVMLPFAPGLASAENLSNILSSWMPLLIASVGQTFVLISGGIDLSISSVIALASITGAGIMNANTGWLHATPLAAPAGVAGMLLVGSLAGFANGVAVTRFKMPAFIVTLTAMMFFSGLAIWVTGSKNIRNLPPAFNAIGGKLLPALGVTLLVAGIAQLAVRRSLFGQWLYAVGHNPKAALISGVPVSRVVIWAYIVSGACAATAAVLYTGRLETGSPVLGQRVLLDVVGATVIGGTSLYGGQGKIAGTVFGALFLTLLDNSLNLMNLSYFTIMMAKGTVILLAAVIDTTRHRLMAGA